MDSASIFLKDRRKSVCTWGLFWSKYWEIYCRHWLNWIELNNFGFTLILLIKWILYWLQEDWVLCRVFYKGKTDNSAKLSPQDMYETLPPSLTLDSLSPTNQIMPIGYNQLASFSSSMTTHHFHNPNVNQNNSLMNLLQFSKETNTNCSSVTQISPKCDDGYGFLWDMDLDGVASSNLDGMRFEVDNNSMVLL